MHSIKLLTRNQKSTVNSEKNNSFSNNNSNKVEQKKYSFYSYLNAFNEKALTEREKTLLKISNRIDVNDAIEQGNLENLNTILLGIQYTRDITIDDVNRNRLDSQKPLLVSTVLKGGLNEVIKFFLKEKILTPAELKKANFIANRIIRNQKSTVNSEKNNSFSNNNSNKVEQKKYSFSGYLKTKMKNNIDVNDVIEQGNLEDLNTILSEIPYTRDITIDDINRNRLDAQKPLLISTVLKRGLNEVIEFFLKEKILTIDELNKANFITNKINQKKYSLYFYLNAFHERTLTQLQKSDNSYLLSKKTQSFEQKNNVEEVNQHINVQEDSLKMKNNLDVNNAIEQGNLENLNTILLDIQNTRDITIGDANRNTLDSKKLSLLSIALNKELDEVVKFFLKQMTLTIDELNEVDLIANRIKSDDKSKCYRWWIQEKRALYKENIANKIQ